MTLTLGQVADLLHADGDFLTSQEVVGYSIDSRTIGAGELFFAVKGERVDGHDYVAAALANGATAAVVRAGWIGSDEIDASRLMRVADVVNDLEECEDCVLGAMQRLAHAVRRMWGGRVIGVTGSAGKTTTKEMIAAVLGARFRVLKSAGNLNNHFGVPLQLLRLEPEHEVAVIEMGMNHAGEIAALAKIAEPNWGVVSNVAAVHLEFFPEGITGIAAAKYELIAGLPEDGIAVLNADNEYVASFARGMGSRAILYGTTPQATVRAEAIVDMGFDGLRFRLVAGVGTALVRLQLAGQHNVLNALAAIAVGLKSEMRLAECVAAVEAIRPGDRRGEVLEWRGVKIVNDCYNSNPRALDSMVDALVATKASRRVVVAGEMLELGEQSRSLHEACGRLMAKLGVDVVVGVRGMAEALVAGASAASGGSGKTEAVFFETNEAAGQWLRANLQEGDAMLVKGSRGVRLERTLAVLMAE